MTNDFTGAEKLFREGMGVDGDKPAPAVSIGDDDGNDVNLLAPWRMTAWKHATSVALRPAIRNRWSDERMASLANDQLDECLARLWEADALATLDTNWVGKKVVRGVCTLCAGVVQCLQQNIVRGVYNILSHGALASVIYALRHWSIAAWLLGCPFGGAACPRGLCNHPVDAATDHGAGRVLEHGV